MLRDLLFALELGIRVIGIFVFCVGVGMVCDYYFHTKVICLIIGVVIAFIYVMKMLLGVKHG